MPRSPKPTDPRSTRILLAAFLALALLSVRITPLSPPISFSTQSQVSTERSHAHKPVFDHDDLPLVPAPVGVTFFVPTSLRAPALPAPAPRSFFAKGFHYNRPPPASAFAV